MAVPANSAAYLRNTTNGAFEKQNQGGTVLGNTTTGDAITKALALKDNSAPPIPTSPKVKDNGLSANQKAQSGGTFAYDGGSASGERFVMMTYSTNLGGVANTVIQRGGRQQAFSSNDSVMRARNQYGAKTVTAFRANRFSWTGTKSYGTAGATLANRINWVAATTAGGNAAAAPDALNENYWDPVAAATSANSDSAANPTRAVPGELVMKADFVNIDITGTGDNTAGDFFDYKSITGM